MCERSGQQPKRGRNTIQHVLHCSRAISHADILPFLAALIIRRNKPGAFPKRSGSYHKILHRRLDADRGDSCEASRWNIPVLSALSTVLTMPHQRPAAR